jgi:hypothetical protein
MKRILCLSVLASVLLWFGAQSLNAVPITMSYQVTGTGPTYSYTFTLVLDNHDSTWVAGQGWPWLIFGDVPSPGPTNLTSWSGVGTVFPVGPWTGFGSSGGGHNGPNLAPVGNAWIPAALNETLTWKGTSTADIPQGQLKWSTISTHVNGAVPANFEVAQRIDARLDVTPTAGTTQNVYANEQGPGNNGFVAGAFNITNASATQMGTATAIQIEGSGSGDHTAAYAEFSLWRESGVAAGFDAAGDVSLGTATFSGTPTRATFPLPAGGEQDFPASASKDYYLVAKLNNSAVPGDTFRFVVSALTVSGATSSGGVPSSTMNGFDILAPIFAVADASPARRDTFAGQGGFLLQQFTVGYPAGPANTITSLSLLGSTIGGNLQTDITAADLYRDANSNGTFESATDTLVDTQPGFNASNQLVFNLSGAESQFVANDSRQYFVIVAFASTTPNNAEFQTQLEAAGGTTAGTQFNSLPAPGTGPAPGCIVFASNLHITRTGPTAAATVDNDTQGTGGFGVVIWNGTLATIADPWTVSAVEFTASGTANQQTAYTYLALFTDTNANGTFDGGVDTLAGPAGTVFDASNKFTVGLTTTAFPASTTRRFFLVGKLSGTPYTGQTLNAALSGVTATPPANGQVTGDVGVPSTALIIDLPALTVTAGPNNPLAKTHKAGAAGAIVMAQIRLEAGNNDIDVLGLTVTTGGTGNWSTDFDATNGVEFWVDDGDGAFDAANDAQVFSGPAGATAGGLFTSTVSVSNSQFKHIWVRVNILASAGLGNSTPLTYTAGVAAPADVNTGGVTVLFGAPAPNSNPLGAVEFNVTSFVPLSDLVTGGKAITITGSGFATPISVRIGGVLCGGVAVVTPTQITGLTVPPGSGNNLAIEVQTGTLPMQTLTQTFTYSKVSTTDNDGGSSGCAGGLPGSAWWMLAALVPAIWIRRRFAR